MTVASVGDPARGLETLPRIGGIGQRGRPVDGDVVVVIKHDQAGQLQMPGERDRFVADPFHQIAVGRHHIGLVIDQSAAEARVHMPFGQRHADRIGNALTQRAGGGLDPRNMAVFRVAGAGAAQFAEMLDVFDGDAGIAGQPQERVKQHRAMAAGEHEAVPVRPMGIGGVEFQKAGKQHGGDIGHPHRHAGVAGFGVFDRIHRQRPDGVGKAAKFARLFPQRCGAGGVIHRPVFLRRLIGLSEAKARASSLQRFPALPVHHAHGKLHHAAEKSAIGRGAELAPMAQIGIEMP